MAHVSENLAGVWTVHKSDGSTAPNPAKIDSGNEPGKVVFTNENGEKSEGKFISPTLFWAAGYHLYGFVMDGGNTVMWRHNNVCWVRQS